jgi:predicted dehydrogenase
VTTSLQLNRRQFLKQSTAAALLASALPVLGAAPTASRYRTALIGCGWWGNNILTEAMASGGCRIVGLCDVDRGFLQDTVARVTQVTGDTPKAFRDYRDMLADTKPEIVIVGSPDHWHPLQTIDAVRAGAHVYVEKPIGHTIREGRAMVNAARQTGKIVQVGTHRRVSPHNVSGRGFIQSGKLGKVGMVRAFVHYGGSGPERPRQNVEPPPQLDWDLWCGPAPLRPFNGDPTSGRGGIHPRGFRSYLDYANGTLGDWGIHWMDQIVWILEQRWPRKISSYGGRPIKGPPVLNAEEQTTDAPDHQVAIYEFDGFTVSWEHRQFAGNQAEKGENVGCYFYGTEGTLHLGWQRGWTFYPADGRKPIIHEKPQLNEPDQQNIRGLWTDLLGCIESGRRPVCDIEEIHHSTNISLLGMLSLKLGRSLAWDGAREEVPGDPEANRLLARTYRKGYTYPS